MRGTKIILMLLENIKFIDSVNYPPMPLSALPKSLDLPITMKKRYLPHLFNTIENEFYVGPLPPTKYYSPNTMKSNNSLYDNDDDDDDDCERKIFLMWYKETLSSNNIFDMRKEIIEYCTRDVEILTEACIKFQKLFLEECNVYPFSKAVTLPSACNLLFRRNFLKENTIGMIPYGCYRWKDNQSAKAIQRLLWMENEKDLKLNMLRTSEKLK